MSASLHRRALLATLTAWSAAALAQTSTLVVDAPPGSCVSEPALRDEVKARLGREPPDSAGRFFIVVTARPARTVVELTTVKDSERSTRTFSSADCREALESVALAIAVVVDPAVLLAPMPAPARPPTPAPAPPPPQPVSPVVPPTPTPPVPLHVGGGVLGGFAAGLSATPTASFGAAVALRRAALRLGLEGRAELPSSTQTGAQLISSFAVLGSLIPSWQSAHVRVGLPVSVGALFLTSEQGLAALRVTRPLVLVGPEVAARFAPLPWLGLEVFARVQLVATRVSVLSGPETVWVTWPVSLFVGLAGNVGTDESSRE